MKIEIQAVTALQDNYCYLVSREGSDIAIVIDPSEAEPIEAALGKKRLGLILNTHHHHDHVGGNRRLHEKFNAPVYTSSVDFDRVPNAERGLKDQEEFEFDGILIRTLAIPGHTRGQIAFYLPEAHAVFVGDTVFAMGCGRLFEGTPEIMIQSFRTLMKLPQETRLYFGHEYTKRNSEFAASVDPDNREIQDRATKLIQAPTLAEEKRVNPFMRTSEPAIRRALDMATASDVEVFAKLREMRNSF